MRPSQRHPSTQAPAAGSAPAPAAASKDGASKDAKKGPLTPAEQEQEYRKRQAESRKSAEKSQAEAQAKSDLSENCSRSREALRTLQSGERVTRMNPSGERYYLNDDQVNQEITKAQQSVDKSCK